VGGLMAIALKLTSRIDCQSKATSFFLLLAVCHRKLDMDGFHQNIWHATAAAENLEQVTT